MARQTRKQKMAAAKTATKGAVKARAKATAAYKKGGGRTKALARQKKAIKGFGARRAALGVASYGTLKEARATVGRGSKLGARLRSAISKGNKAGAAKIRAQMKGALVKGGLAAGRGATKGTGKVMRGTGYNVKGRTGRQGAVLSREGRASRKNATESTDNS